MSCVWSSEQGVFSRIQHIRYLSRCSKDRSNSKHNLQANPHPLVSLDLSDNGIGGQGCQSISEALATKSELRSLEIGKNRWSASAAQLLSETRLQSLVQFGIGDNRLGDIASEPIIEVLTVRDLKPKPITHQTGQMPYPTNMRDHKPKPKPKGDYVVGKDALRIAREGLRASVVVAEPTSPPPQAYA